MMFPLFPPPPCLALRRFHCRIPRESQAYTALAPLLVLKNGLRLPRSAKETPNNASLPSSLSAGVKSSFSLHPPFLFLRVFCSVKQRRPRKRIYRKKGGRGLVLVSSLLTLSDRDPSLAFPPRSPTKVS